MPDTPKRPGLEENVVELASPGSELHDVLASIEIAALFLDGNLRILRHTPAATELLDIDTGDDGHLLSELASRMGDSSLQEDARAVLRNLTAVENEVQSRDGKWLIRRIMPYRSSEDRVLGVVVTFTDVTRLKRTSRQLEKRERQQAVIAALGRTALRSGPLQEFFDEAVRKISETLEIEYCKLLELEPDGKRLRLRAGVGWKEGFVGRATVETGARSQAGYALQSRGPVIVHELATERRFTGPKLLTEHGVVSGMSVIIGSIEAPWGVLGAHSKWRAHFTIDDVNFLQAAAHLLAETIHRRNAESKIAEARRELELIADSVPVLIAYVDREERHQFTNAAYAKWLGLDQTELHGRRVEDVVGPEAYALLRPHIERALAGTRVAFEELVRRETGGSHWMLGNYVPRTDDEGEVIGFYAAIADITELQDAKNKLRESEERLRLSQEAGEVGTWDWDVRSDETVCSEQYFRIYGLPSRKSITLDDWLQRVHPDDLERVELRMREVLEKREPLDMEFRVVRPDGMERWIARRGKLHSHGVDGPHRVLGVDLDVTERKQAEIRWRQTREELAKANQLKDEFLAMLGHELRNPLGAISNGVQLLRRATSAEDRDWTEEMLARQTKQLERLVGDLLDVARITRGEIEIRPEPVALASCIEAAVESIRERLRESSRELELRLPSERIELMADPARMEQIFSNLLGNAVKYTEPGGHIELSVERSDGEVVVRVYDDGRGLAAEDLELVFEPFMRVGKSLDRAGSGLGVGLTLVKKLTELHGGTVSARSEGLGKGSEFAIRLPIMETSSRAPRSGSPPARAGESALPALRILVVDDNRDLAMTLKRTLEANGHEVQTAYDGQHGLELAERFAPDAALVDIGLPGIDGYEVAKRMRRESSTPIWLAAISGYKQTAEQTAAEDTFDAYFIKPVASEALEAFLTRAARDLSRAEAAPPPENGSS